MSIMGNMIGAYSQIGKTFVITDESGNELTGVVTEKEQIFTATDNDVREGSVYASDSGVSTGTKNIPSYRTTQGEYGVFAGESISIPLAHYDQYNYTKFQCIISQYDNISTTSSVCAIKVVINDCAYDVNSSDVISEITKNPDLKSIDLNIINTSDNDWIVHYFTYKEEE